MTSLSDAVPLSAHRDSLARYLAEIGFTFESVAGKIIAERLEPGFVRDPLRACLLLWAACANGGQLSDALPVAAAFDLFDRFMLLHDELAEGAGETAARWGVGQSLNAGDALYAVAFRCLAADAIVAPNRLDAARLAAEAVLAALESDPAQSRRVLTAAAMEAGAVIAGAPAHAVAALRDAGHALAAAGESGDAAEAGRLAERAISLVRGCTHGEAVDAFVEVARNVARRAA